MSAIIAILATASRARGARTRKDEPNAAPAHPPDDPGGHAQGQGVVGDVRRHDGAGADEGVAADRVAKGDEEQ